MGRINEEEEGPQALHRDSGRTYSTLVSVRPVLFRLWPARRHSTPTFWLSRPWQLHQRPEFRHRLEGLSYSNPCEPTDWEVGFPHSTPAFVRWAASLQSEP